MTEKLSIEVGANDRARGGRARLAHHRGLHDGDGPVILGQWVGPGQYVANVTRWELDQEVLNRITLIGQMLERTPLALNDYRDDNFGGPHERDGLRSGQPDERARIPEAGTFGPTGATRPSATASTGRPASGPSRAARTTSRSWPTRGRHHRRSRQQRHPGPAVRRRRRPGAYELAAEKGLGYDLPTEMFLQDIPT